MMTKRMWMIGVGLFLAAIGLQSLWRLREPSPPPEVESTAETAAPSPPVSAAPPPVSGSSERETGAILWNRLEQRAQLIRFPLPEEGGETLVPLTISIVGVCHPGDANAIELDLKSQPTHQAMLTLENLSNGKVYRQNLSPTFFRSPETPVSFRLPPVKTATQFGLYLCTAGAADEDCGRKPYRDLNQIFAEHSAKKADAGLETRIIFFQYVLIDERGAATFGRPAGAQNFAELKAYAKERKLAEAPITRAESLTLALKGYPLAGKKGRLVVPLPQYDSAKCGQQFKAKAGGNGK